MATLIKALLQPVAIVWLGLLALCVWQIYKRHYRWAACPAPCFCLYSSLAAHLGRISVSRPGSAVCAHQLG